MALQLLGLIQKFYISMCSNPISVPNPLYCRKGFASQFGQIVELSSDFSPKSEFIEVPCGKCSECRSTYFNSLLQRAICESRSSYMFFVTLTYDDKHIPFIDLDGERILYADYSHLQDMFKRVRRRNILNREFRYFCVNEYGDNYSRPHFHILIFVARHSDDDKFTPFYIERLLYDNLKLYWSLNVGTRKNPIYEPLFTYSSRLTRNGLQSNYYVKYVEPDTEFDFLKDSDDSSYIRTIRYLIGYLNTSTKVDSSIEFYLKKHSHDSELCKRLSRLLSCRVRYSKGFGCGFVDGEKYYLPKISVRASSNSLVYSELLQNLPDKVDDFIEFYPEQYELLLDWISNDVYSNYSSLDECYKHFTVDDFYLHSLTLKYFPKHFSNHYRNLWGSPITGTISDFFKVLRTTDYKVKKVVTSIPVDSELFQFLRKGVDDGLRNSLPFIAFPIKSQLGYFAMCKYYRDRVTTFDDIRNMYNSIGVDDFDGWRSKFLKQYSTLKSDIALGNTFKYKNNSEIILSNQKKSLSLLRRSAFDFGVYSHIFVL